MKCSICTGACKASRAMTSGAAISTRPDPRLSQHGTRPVVKLLPEQLTLGRLMVPFDVMSRTMMIAVANPFDALGKEAAQQLLDYNVQWHIAQPRSIMKVLAEAHRIAL